MRGEHLRYRKVESDGHYIVFTKRGNEVLGEIYWKEGWRQWVFEPLEDTFWSWDCLENVVERLKEFNAGGCPRVKRMVSK